MNARRISLILAALAVLLLAFSQLTPHAGTPSPLEPYASIVFYAGIALLVVALIVALRTKPQRSEARIVLENLRSCEHCGSQIPESARICAFCGREQSHRKL